MCKGLWKERSSEGGGRASGYGSGGNLKSETSGNDMYTLAADIVGAARAGVVEQGDVLLRSLEMGQDIFNRVAVFSTNFPFVLRLGPQRAGVLVKGSPTVDAMPRYRSATKSLESRKSGGRCRLGCVVVAVVKQQIFLRNEVIAASSPAHIIPAATTHFYARCGPGLCETLAQPLTEPS